MDGAIVVDKESGWTSHDVVGRMRRIANTKRIGHLGTLDPMATGVLPLVIGRATRLAQFYTRGEKVYEGTVRFGWATDTYDRDGTPTSAVTEFSICSEDLARALDRFRGEILQAPPPVSAKKVDGVRAYKLARQKQIVALPPVPVQVHEIGLLEVSGSEARLRVRCSGGTYIRSIAHDLGQILGCGAHLSSLRRLAADEFTVQMAKSLAQLGELAEEGRLSEAFISPAQMVPDFPTVYVDSLTVSRIRQGCNFQVSAFRPQQASRHIKAVSEEGELVAIAEVVLPNLYHPSVVL